MGKWKKVPRELESMLDEMAARFKAERRQMFGCPCFFVKGNMFAGAHEDNVILRLSEDDRRDIAAAHDEVGPFEPMAGRPMREYVALPESVYGDPGVLDEWLTRAHAFASSLPTRKKSKKKR